MSLIAIAHSQVPPLAHRRGEEARADLQDQAFIPGKRAEYPEQLETYRTTRTGLQIFIRPVKISDEPKIKDFFYSLSDRSLNRRFLSQRKDMPHERLRDFVVIDHTKEVLLLAVTGDEENELIVAVGQYGVDRATHSAEVAFAVRDDHQNRGIGSELLSYLTYLAKRKVCSVLRPKYWSTTSPCCTCSKRAASISEKTEAGVYDLHMAFQG